MNAQTRFMANSMLSAQQVADFHRDGYLIVRSMFDPEEIGILRGVAKADAAIKGHAYLVDDGKGAATKLVLWNKAGKDIYGAVARGHRIVDSMEELLGDEVYHYHSKMSIKAPFTGGAWNWHQDYGYWYMNGCLFPDMASAFIAVAPTRAKMAASRCCAVRTSWAASSTASSASRQALTRSAWRTR